MHDFYELAGPDGSNTAMSFLIEVDPGTTIDDLLGTGPSTPGDWVTGTNYPIIDNADVGAAYKITGFPAVFMVCQDRSIAHVNHVGVDADSLISLTNSCASIAVAPKPIFRADIYDGCGDMEVQFTDDSWPRPTSYLWDFGDGNTSTEQHPTHFYDEPGDYSVTLSVTNDFGTNELQKQGMISLGIGAPNDNESCGPTDNTFGDGGIYSPGIRGLYFDVWQPTVISSVKVYAEGEAMRKIVLYDISGKMINSREVIIPDGESRVNLDFFVDSGWDYLLGMEGDANLYRNTTGAVYPYTHPTMAITASTIGWGVQGPYYYFYDWDVRRAGCDGIMTAECGMNEVEVIVEINPDDYPNETSWNLLANNLEILAGGFNSDTICVDAEACIQFQIYDTFGDGICCGFGDGSYAVYVDGAIVGSGGEFTISENATFNCPIGSVCENPYKAELGSMEAPIPYSFYEFTPDSSGTYSFSTCDLTTCDTKLWIYENCGSDVLNYDEGDDNECGLQSYIEADLLADESYILKVGLFEEGTECSASTIGFNIDYVGDPCTDCNIACYEPYFTGLDIDEDLLCLFATNADRFTEMLAHLMYDYKNPLWTIKDNGEWVIYYHFESWEGPVTDVVINNMTNEFETLANQWLEGLTDFDPDAPETVSIKVFGFVFREGVEVDPSFYDTYGNYPIVMHSEENENIPWELNFPDGSALDGYIGGVVDFDSLQVVGNDVANYPSAVFSPIDWDSYTHPEGVDMPYTRFAHKTEWYAVAQREYLWIGGCITDYATGETLTDVFTHEMGHCFFQDDVYDRGKFPCAEGLPSIMNNGASYPDGKEAYYI